MIYREEKIKLYLSGPISGIPNYEDAFKRARKKLLVSGYEVEDPTTYGFDHNTPWHLAMKYDVARMLKCDGVATLYGWDKSTGARLEVKLAKDLQIRVMEIEKWIAKNQ